MLTIERAQSADIDALCKIEKACFRDPWTRQMIEETLELDNAHVFLAKIEGKAAGYFCFYSIIDEAHIANIAVLPEFRRQSIGKAMLRYLMDMAQSQGMKAVTLEVRLTNAVAQHLYLDAGFSIVGIRPKYYRDGEDALVMWKYF